ncbi:glycosyltransferase family 4 protein [Ignavibacteria bacterium CHB1]|nr:MAG: glycosyltransferase family 1 protein [Chlorobiota bacterium]MBV6398222.1 N-acetyl-alpha-D-glucosaminyl L-malate synthase [Ignavibacteria bacterium]MCC6885864.1 glycosyltransferase family 4 protein [Ignavibacteriales bacterium]MCE7953478.1 glycosyltransferase family 1 protein [Chlorobi bacterium CHB7]MDL1887414.1 glycosyltransferase family 4 protein [Ignavibacteria bacterium CHB1]RIK48657.1 MAG: hypothetical protein DCC60_06335 [Ignavibacteriota bacterium]
MKVLMISPNFNKVCGRSRMVYNLIRGLKEKNIHCELITNGGDNIAKLKSLNVKVHFEDVNPEKKNISGFLKARSKLIGLTQSGEFEIVHVHHRFHDLLLSSVTFQNYRSVHTVHSYLSGKRSFGFNADLIVPVSFFIRDHLIKDHRVNTKKLTTIHNFINPGDYNFDMKLEKLPGHFVILTIGRFHPEKDLFTQLKAMKYLNNPNVKLLICGEGEEGKLYSDFIKENKLNVELISKTDNISSLISMSDICMMSSVNEPFGLFVLESGLYRKPFIGANSGGIKELIDNQITGFLFPARDPEKLAMLIRETINNFDAALKCGENLYRKVIENFTPERGIEEYINCYNKLLNDQTIRK